MAIDVDRHAENLRAAQHHPGVDVGPAGPTTRLLVAT